MAAEAPVTSYQSALTAYESSDFGNALIFAKLAGTGGNTDAQVLAGHILAHGQGMAADKNEAVKWYLQAAKLGNTDAMVALGELGLENAGGLSASDALKWLKNAAEKGRTGAMRALSDIYRLGKGTPPNAYEAEKWLQKAANYGDSEAFNRLGDLKFEKDPQGALKYYEDAATRGDADAAYIAAIIYAENFDILPNANKVAKLLEQAAQAGIPAAMADYGLIVYQGNGAPRSAEKAAQWFKKSAIAGDSEGRFLYAFTLAKGEGIAQNYEQAYYWLLRADQDSGKTGVVDYDTSRQELRTRLEKNVDPATLSRARERAKSDRLSSIQ